MIVDGSTSPNAYEDDLKRKTTALEHEQASSGTNLEHAKLVYATEPDL